MKKGFTLIELLAVIVILAIIALIAVPIVISIINESKKESQIKTAELYVDGVIQAIANYQLNNHKKEVNPIECNVQVNGNVICNPIEEELEVKVNGKKATSGTITFDKGKIVSYENIKIDTVYVSKDEQGKTTISTKPSGPVSFASDLWDTIKDAVKKGKTQNYHVGDTKCVALTGKTTKNNNGCSNGEFLVRIANMSKDDPICQNPNNTNNSQTACGFVVEFVDIIETHNMNSEAINTGGWPATAMRSYLNTDILGAMPEELQSAIIETKVVSGHGSGDSNPNRDDKNWESTDKLYLLSAHEVWEDGTSNKVSSRDTSYNQTRQLDYYKAYKNTDESIGVTTNNYVGVIKQLNGSNNYWWLRSAASNYTFIFLYASSSGGWNATSATGTSGVSAAFRIG